MKKLIFDNQDFLNLFNLPNNVSFTDFCNKLSVLNISDTTGTFAVRSDIDTFINRVSKKDDRKSRLPLYKQKLYQILYTDRNDTLSVWFKGQAELKEKLEFYFNIPYTEIFSDDTFAGRTKAKYGRICKNINFKNFYNTKKLYTNDSEYTFGLITAMFEDFKIRNSLASPAFFDHICNYDGDSQQFWHDFMMGANRASIFNPVTYKGILDTLFEGETLFAPVMGWNAYQLGFYSSKFTNFVATDVIPDVVDNGRLLNDEYKKYCDNSLYELPEKNIDLYLCPSEELDKRHGFIEKYKDKIDAVLLSPPYYDLEIYDSEDQSFANFPNYDDWLAGYWEETVKICASVMKPGAKFGFVISNYVNKQKQKTTISEDMSAVVSKYLDPIHKYRVQWSAIKGTRQAKKTREGNFEDLWLFEKV
jgi:hypothetical protein